MRGKKKDKKQKTPLREIAEWVLTLVAAILIALPIRAFAFELARVDGESMEGTLSNGEIMFVAKFDYTTAWLSFPWQDAEAKENAPRVVAGGDPRRFDVVICRYPGRGDTDFVKRVVGLPGETVELRDGYLYVDGVRYEEAYIRDEYRAGPRNSFGPVTVPEGQYFVLGDHRNNSNDSRTVGTLSRDVIIGRAGTVLYPFGAIREIK